MGEIIGMDWAKKKVEEVKQTVGQTVRDTIEKVIPGIHEVNEALQNQTERINSGTDKSGQKTPTSR
jgi:hypothetical protein